jgi:hypothetical protein
VFEVHDQTARASPVIIPLPHIILLALSGYHQKLVLGEVFAWHSINMIYNSLTQYGAIYYDRSGMEMITNQRL